LAEQADPAKLAVRNVAVENLDDVDAYDLVVLDNVFEHLPNQGLALDKIRTCMAARGVLFMLVPNKLWPIEVHYRLPLLSYLPLPLANVYLRCTRRGVDYRDASYAPTYLSLNRLLRSAGFEHRYVLPGDIRLATYGHRWVYRWGAAAIARFPWLWILSKVFLVIARKR
jgi:SAM-dependent methyltransferase